jgi:hypothetical protein
MAGLFAAAVSVPVDVQRSLHVRAAVCREVAQRVTQRRIGAVGIAQGSAHRLETCHWAGRFERERVAFNRLLARYLPERRVLVVERLCPHSPSLYRTAGASLSLLLRTSASFC